MNFYIYTAEIVRIVIKAELEGEVIFRIARADGLSLSVNNLFAYINYIPEIEPISGKVDFLKLVRFQET